MKTGSMKAKLINCLFAFILAFGLMVPSVGSFTASAYGEPNIVETTNAVTDESSRNQDDRNQSIENDQGATEPTAVATTQAESQVVMQSEQIAPLSAWTSNYDLIVSGGVEGADYEFKTFNYSRHAYSGSNTLSDLKSIPMLEIKSSTPLTISSSAKAKTGIRIAPGVEAYLTFNNVSIESPVPCDIVTNSANPKTADKTLKGAPTKLHLTLADGSENTLSAVDIYHSPGLRCGEGSELYIDDATPNQDLNGDSIVPVQGVIPAGTVYKDKNGNTRTVGTANGDNSMSNLESNNPGSLLVKGGYRAAAIGSGAVESSGRMEFSGGDITVKPWCLQDDRLLDTTVNWDYSDGAGIGSGYAGHGTETIFNGGSVDAYGSYHGSGIGAGIWSYNDSSDATLGDGAANWAYRCYPFDDAIYSGLTVGGTSETPSTQTLCGDITINGGYLKAHGGLHGNAFGQGCGGTARDCTILITGGTLLPDSTDKMFDIGGKLGDVIITGGSVNCNKNSGKKYKFQGNAGEGLAWGNTEKTFKVSLTTTNVKSKIDSLAVTNNPSLKGTENPGKASYNSRIESWELLVNKYKVITVEQGDKEYSYEYGAPSRLDSCLLYLWLPEGINKTKRVDVNFGYLVDGKLVTSQTTQPPIGEGGTVSQPRETEVFPLPKSFTDNLSKYYDGLSLPGLGVKKDDEKTWINVNNPSDGKLNDPDVITYDAQRFDRKDGTSIESSVSASTMPSDTGIFRVEVISTQYGTQPGFCETYWAHAATGWASISPVMSKTDLHVKNAIELTINGVKHTYSEPTWIQQKENVSGSDIEYNTATNNHLIVPIDITSDKLPFGDTVDGSDMSKPTCLAPTGRLQLYIDGEAVPESLGGVKRIAFDRTSGKPVAKDNDKTYWVEEDKDDHNREHTVGYFDITRAQLEAFGLKDKSNDDSMHDVYVEYTSAATNAAPRDEEAEQANTLADDSGSSWKPAHNDSAYLNYYESQSDPTSVKIELTDPDFVLFNEASTGFIPGDSSEENTNRLVLKDIDGKPVSADAIMKDSNKGYRTNVSDYRDKVNDDGTTSSQENWFPIYIQTNSIGDITFTSSNPNVLEIEPADKTTQRDYVPGKTDYGIGARAVVKSAGKTTITAELAGTGAYRSAKQSFDVYVFPDLSTEPELTASAISYNTSRSDGTIRPDDTIRYLTTITNKTPDTACLNPVFTLSVPEDSELQAVKAFDDQGRDLGEITYHRQGDKVVVDSLPTLFGGQSYYVALDTKVKPDIVDKTPAETGLKSETMATGVYGINPDAFNWDDRFNYRDGEDVKEVSAEANPTSKAPENPDPDDPDPSNPNPDNPKPDNPGVKPDPNSRDDHDLVVIPSDVDPRRDGDITTTKTAANVTTGYDKRANKAIAQVGDKISFTITVTNTKPGSSYYDVIVKDELPKGLQYVPGSSKVSTFDGKEYTNFTVDWNQASSIIGFCLGDVPGGKQATVTFACIVTGKALEFDDISNTAKTFGTEPSETITHDPVDPDTPSDPDDPSEPDDPTKPQEPVTIHRDPTPPGPYNPEDDDTTWDDKENDEKDVIKDILGIPEDEEIDIPESDPANPGTPSPMDPVLPGTKDENGKEILADITLAKQAQNLTRDDGNTHVGDVVRYTITVENTKEFSTWYDAVVRDVMPQGLEIICNSIKLTDAEGVTHEVPDAAYNVPSRTLAVSCGNLPGLKSFVVVFDALVTKDALNSDVGNTASVHGTLPSQKELSDIDITPGSAFNPPSGWSEYLENHPGIINPNPTYPSKNVTAQGGIIDDEVADNDKTTIAKTSDTTAFVIGGVAVIALCAIGLLIYSRRRMKRNV